jgi:hypothetical protein
MDLHKKTCQSLRIFFMLFGLYFMPPDQISNMSLNDLRRRVATHLKTQTETHMDEPSFGLDLRHQVSTSGAPSLSFNYWEKCLSQDI